MVELSLIKIGCVEISVMFLDGVSQFTYDVMRVQGLKIEFK